MPRPGDLTICANCGTILRFDRLLRLEVPTLEELERLPQGTLGELKEQQERWRLAHGGGKVISLPLRR